MKHTLQVFVCYFYIQQTVPIGISLSTEFINGLIFRTISMSNTNSWLNGFIKNAVLKHSRICNALQISVSSNSLHKTVLNRFIKNSYNNYAPIHFAQREPGRFILHINCYFFIINIVREIIPALLFWGSY